MSRNWAATVGVVGLIGAVGCGAQETPVDEPEVSRVSLLPTAADLPAGAQIEPLDSEEKMVLGIKLYAETSGLGLEGISTFDPRECQEQKRYTDESRLALIEDGSAVGTIIDFDRTYIVLVSETGLDVSRVADAHTGLCSTYSVEYIDNVGSYQRTVRTERLDLPAALGSDDAVILSEVSERANPDWADNETMLGFATLDGYTVMVLGYQGKESEAEFGEVFTSAVDKVRLLT